MAKLTNRQRDVVRLLAQGYSQKEAARRLGLRYGYVRQVVKTARDRAECRSTVEIVYRAMHDEAGG